MDRLNYRKILKIIWIAIAITSWGIFATDAVTVVNPQPIDIVTIVASALAACSWTIVAVFYRVNK